MGDRRGEVSLPGRPCPSDYQADPARFAANETATALFSRGGDVHQPVAGRLASATTGPVLDLGGGTGHLAQLLTARSVTTVVVARRCSFPVARHRALHTGVSLLRYLCRQAERVAGRVEHDAVPVGRRLVGGSGRSQADGLDL